MPATRRAPSRGTATPSGPRSARPRETTRPRDSTRSREMGAAGRGGPGRRPGSGTRPRSRPRRPVGPARVAVVAALLVVGIVWLVAFSSVFDVDEVDGVDVVGASPEALPLVADAARVDPGTSLLWLDTDDVAARVLALPRVATVDVRRSLPGTLVVAVTERTPVVGAPAPGGTALVDPSGLAYRTVADPPAGLPVLRLAAPPSAPGTPPGPVPVPSPGDPATVAAVHVVDALPPVLRARVAEVRAPSPYAVELGLADGPVVRWGADERNDTKVAVLSALLTRPGTTYDVSTPEIAVVS